MTPSAEAWLAELRDRLADAEAAAILPWLTAYEMKTEANIIRDFVEEAAAILPRIEAEASLHGGHEE